MVPNLQLEHRASAGQRPSELRLLGAGIPRIKEREATALVLFVSFALFSCGFQPQEPDTGKAGRKMPRVSLYTKYND